MFTMPGRFSLDYCGGTRKKYFKPLSFFLLLVIVYLLFPFAQGLNMSLWGHLHTSRYTGYARNEVIKLMTVHGLSEKYIFEEFQRKSELVSKFLLVLIIPMMALLTWRIAGKKSTYYYDHFVFSTEINYFMVMWGFLIMPLLGRFVFWVISLLTGSELFSDAVFGAVLVGSICLYIFIGAKRLLKLILR